MPTMLQKVCLIALVFAGVAAGCFVFNRTPRGFPSETPAVAPDSFDVEMVTTKGPMIVRVHRAWSPNGADRFYNLVRVRFFARAPMRGCMGPTPGGRDRQGAARRLGRQDGGRAARAHPPGLGASSGSSWSSS